MKIVADENIPFVAECFSSLGDVQLVPGRKMSAGLVRDVDCLLVRSVTKVNEQLLAGSKAKFVATATIGLEHIDVEYLKSKGIGFASAPGSNANSVAEYIVAALLSVGKKHNITLEGKSIGIVGAGNVGSRVAGKCRALGMDVKLNDPPLARQTGDTKYLPLEQLFGCDFVTLHTPLTYEGPDDTFHLENERFFGALKAGCVFINTSRGGVHSTAALKQAIRSGRLGAVVLDVWENEPKIDCELLRMSDISTPHIAGYSLDGKIAGMLMIYKAACEYFNRPVKHKMADFLPRPEVPEITIAPAGPAEKELIRRAVEQVYVINRDDFNTREIATVQEHKRGEFFDDLRKNYPVRREFFNTKVTSKEPCPALKKKLKGIGFSE